MKKLTWIVVAIIIIVVTIIIISQGANNSGAQTIKIGATVALSGNLAYQGEAEYNGLRLAAEDINAKGGIKGRNLEIVGEDNQGDAKAAVSSVQKMLSVDNVDLVFSGFTHITKAVNPIVKQVNKPMFYHSADGTIAEESPLFFKDYFDAGQMGVDIAGQVALAGFKKVKVLSEINDACKLYVDAFKKTGLEKGISVVSEDGYAGTTQDLRSNITKLSLKKGDALVTCSFRHSNILMKQMDELGVINIPTFQLVGPFLPAAQTPEIRALFSKNGTISTWYGFVAEDMTNEQKAFGERYKAKYGVDALSDSLYAYDDVMVIADAIGKCLTGNKIDNACFSAKMLVTDYTGVAGKLSFDAQGRSNRESLVIKAENGAWKRI